MKNMSPMHKLLAPILASVLLASATPARDLGKDIERGLGEMVAAELEAAYGVVDDPLLTDWVDRIGQRLAAASGRTNLTYRFRILDSDDVNAVAAPGGFIYVDRGLLRFIQSEDELAAVLGHEIGHVAGRHAMKQLTAQALGTLALLGFQAARAETLKTVGSVAGGLALLKFSRDEENDADRRGLKSMVAIGYDASALPAFFRRLQSTEREKPSALEVYFLTHPPTEERLRRVAREPGMADTAANAAARGDGYAARFLYRQAAAAYRRALQLDPDNSDWKYRLAESLRRAPPKRAASPLSPDARADALKRLTVFGEELEAARKEAEGDRSKLADSQKEMERELEATARALSEASRTIGGRNTAQRRQLLRLIRSFDRATRISGSLRAAREMADDTIEELVRLRRTMQTALEQGEAATAAQVESLLMVNPACLKDLTTGVRQTRRQAGDALEGVRALRQAADSLVSSYRSPLGYTRGQFDILDMRVSTAQDILNDGVAASRRASNSIARSHVTVLASRINYLTRSVAPDDPAIIGLLARYLGVEPDAVRAMRKRLEFGDAALALAQDRIESGQAKKKSARGSAARPASFTPDPAPQNSISWENVAVLFHLLANDLERETAAPKQ